MGLDLACDQQQLAHEATFATAINNAIDNDDEANMTFEYEHQHQTNTTNDPSRLLSLPAELRNEVFENVFSDASTATKSPDGIRLNDNYQASNWLAPLLVCKQIYLECQHIALARTNFIMRNRFAQVAHRLTVLQPRQIASIRHLTVVTDKRHFLSLDSWGATPLGAPSNLRLDTLTIALYRSNAWHYLFDATASLVRALRVLRGARRVVFVRNGALVKGGLRAWYNRLVGLMMKVEHAELFLGTNAPGGRDAVSWRWSFDEAAQSFALDVVPSFAGMDEQVYLRKMLPLAEELRISVENEEWNPDPRSRRLYP